MHRSTRNSLRRVTEFTSKRWITADYSFVSPSGARGKIQLMKAPSHFGHYSSRVNRPQNEDRYSASLIDSPRGSSLTPKSQREGGKQKVFNFSVFDGHGGYECSEFLSTNLSRYVENLDLSTAYDIAERYRKGVGGYWRHWRNSEIEYYIQRLNSRDDLQLRVPMAFLSADYDYTVAQAGSAGSTCTSVFLYSHETESYQNTTFWDPNQVSTLVVAHVGDTRAILSDHGGVAHRLTAIHHPSSPTESERLSRYASSFFTDSFGEERFGRFANTRAFGDAIGKARGITAEPQMLECRIGDPNTVRTLDNNNNSKSGVRVFGGNEGFLVMVSDGVSDLVSDQEIVDLVMATAYKSGSMRGTPQEAAKEVVQFAEALGGNDNATCLVIRLSGWGHWNWRDKTGNLREERLRDALDSGRRRDRMA